MDAAQVAALAVLQGLLEFLPVSSSAHLVLLPRLVGWPDQGLAFDVAVHVGTLAAVVAHFRGEIARLARGWARTLRGTRDADGRLAWAIVLATVPVGLAGLAFEHLAATGLREVRVVAWATIGFALALWAADRWGRGRRTLETLRWHEALLVGLAQALAIVPGASRSGVTMAAGLALGMTREAAARFSFLLSMPVIALAGTLEAVRLVQVQGPVPWGAVAAGAMLAGLTAWVVIALFLRWIERVGMTPFVVYRLALGAVLLAAL